MAGGRASPVLRFIRKIASARSSGKLTDGQLLQRFAAQRDADAFAALVQRHGPLVLSVCRRVLRHEHDAEDAFQATFLVLVRRARSIAKSESVGSWLYGVAYRIAAKARTGAARRRSREKPMLDLPAAESHSEVLWNDLRPVLDEEVQRLPEKYRAALVLCYLQGKTTDEAAQDLGCPRGTVGTRVARGRELLRSRLVRRGVTLSTALLGTLLAQNPASAVPAPLGSSTVRAATLFAADRAAAVSPAVISLTKGALKAMFISKLKIAAAVVLAVGLAGTSTGVLTYHALAGGPAAIRKADRPKPLARDADKPKKDADAEPEEESTPAFKDRSANNLKQIGLAFHTYHDKHGSFPAHAIYSKDGKALLSWRVAILPYVDQNELYKDFKLDEPWDSEHNKKLLAKMPEIYARPGTKINNPTKTYYQGFVGQGAAFEGTMGTTFATFTDGLSNTILAIEAKEPVPWTKPADLTFEPDKELPKLGGIFKDGLGVLIADGSVRFVKKGFDEKKMRAFVIRNSGQVKADFDN